MLRSKVLRAAGGRWWAEREEGRTEGSGRRIGSRSRWVHVRRGHVVGGVLAGSRDVMVRSWRRASYQDCSRSRVRGGEERDDDNGSALSRERASARRAARRRTDVGAALPPLLGRCTAREPIRQPRTPSLPRPRCYVPLAAERDDRLSRLAG